jgi:hypothetical protein
MTPMSLFLNLAPSRTLKTTLEKVILSIFLNKNLIEKIEQGDFKE